MKAASLRARVRAEMTDEIKAVARRHLSTDGANLSLRAVARDLGMASSAVYRYFASRDELLTALIIDAYGSLGDAAEAAPQDWLAVCHAIRDWALANPHEWALIYGSPVPGYQAPQATVPAAARVILTLANTVIAADVPAGEPVTGQLGEELRAVADGFVPGAAPQVVGRAMGAWLHCCGAISAELFGQLQNTVEARREFFEFQMRGAAAWVGIR
jgi:AcrR family transcriptional regulator